MGMMPESECSLRQRKELPSPGTEGLDAAEWCGGWRCGGGHEGSL